ncbi:hypothetical protein NKI56_28610, partial [Mesorhizobium sp. M0622]
PSSTQSPLTTKIESVLQDCCNPDFFNTIHPLLPLGRLNASADLRPRADVNPAQDLATRAAASSTASARIAAPPSITGSTPMWVEISAEPLATFG